METRKVIVHGAATALVVLLAAALYLPFLHNPLVFDDWVFFSGDHFAYYATHPLGLAPRLPGYFTLAAAEVLSGRIEVHRALNLAFHVACAVVLYLLIRELLVAIGSAQGAEPAADGERRGAAAAMFGAGAFAVHPVAVYAAGYLVERSIVVATLFSLLSLLCLLRGALRDRISWTLAAAACYALAVLSKEHSILLPLVALPMVMLLHGSTAAKRRQLFVYAAGCAPFVPLIVFLLRGVIGQAYEPQVEAIATQVGSGANGQGVELSWALSAVTQLGIYFRYLLVWLWPRPEGMSIDLRIDPLATWTPAWIAIKIGAFVAVGAIGALCVRSGGRMGLMGFGLLYSWILFLAELSVSRFQEPFVLYRSYLWMPGIAIAASAVLHRAGTRSAVAAMLLAFPALFYLAHDRLTTFSSPLRLWEDAAAKLPSEPVPWGSRALYNLGLAYLREGREHDALAVIDRCLASYPETHLCEFARGAIHLMNGEYESALRRFERAAQLEPKSGVTQHRIGLALEKLGQLEEAKAHYRKALALGYRGGEMELRRLGEAVPRSGAPAH